MKLPWLHSPQVWLFWTQKLSWFFQNCPNTVFPFSRKLLALSLILGSWCLFLEVSCSSNHSPQGLSLATSIPFSLSSILSIFPIAATTPIAAQQVSCPIPNSGPVGLIVTVLLGFLMSSSPCGRREVLVTKDRGSGQLWLLRHSFDCQRMKDKNGDKNKDE